MARKNDIEAVVAGHICLDIIPAFETAGKTDIKDILAPGKLINMGAVKISTGGPVSNTGLALNILGVNTKLMGKVGDDFFGEGVLKLLAQRKAADGMIVAKGESTSYTVVIIPPGCDRIFLHNPGANNTFCAADINYEMVGRARLFHLGYPPLMRRVYENNGAELVAIYKRVKELGVTTSLDMALPDPESESGRVNWEGILRDLLPYVDIYLPSAEETMFMINRPGYEGLNTGAKGRDPLENLDINCLHILSDKLLALGAKITVIKCGIKGLYIRTGDRERLASAGKAGPADVNNWANRELHEESFYVPEIASATGSGDSSIAGFLAAYLKGKSIEEALKIACAVGGENVQAYDAISGVKSWEETLRLIPGWPKNRLTVEGAYWRYDQAGKLWVGKKDRGYEALG
ncbi:MAG: carbohydrate kinase family protein [Bacillota bacterium]